MGRKNETTEFTEKKNKFFKKISVNSFVAINLRGFLLKIIGSERKNIELVA